MKKVRIREQNRSVFGLVQAFPNVVTPHARVCVAGKETKSDWKQQNFGIQKRNSQSDRQQRLTGGKDCCVCEVMADSRKTSQTDQGRVMNGGERRTRRGNSRVGNGRKKDTFAHSLSIVSGQEDWMRGERRSPTKKSQQIHELIRRDTQKQAFQKMSGEKVNTR